MKTETETKGMAKEAKLKNLVIKEDINNKKNYVSKRGMKRKQMEKIT